MDPLGDGEIDDCASSHASEIGELVGDTRCEGDDSSFDLDFDVVVESVESGLKTCADGPKGSAQTEP